MKPNFTCPVCGKSVRFPPNELAWRRTCSQECYATIRRGQQRVKRVSIICICCQKVFQITPAESRDRTRKYCSMKCMGQHRKDAGLLRREKHPRWAGDKPRTTLASYIRASTAYERWAYAISQRAHGLCEDCDVEGGQAHHLLSFGLLLGLLLNPDNGRFLCEPCHRLRHP